MSEMIERVKQGLFDAMAQHLQDSDGLALQNGRFFISGADCHIDADLLARAAIEAMKYADADEDRLLKVAHAERIEAVSLSLAWDALIDEALNPTLVLPAPPAPMRRGPDFKALFDAMGWEVIDISPCDGSNSTTTGNSGKTQNPLAKERT